jgi:SAM-dependent methyltransferase
MFKDCNKYIGIDFPDYSINKDMHNGKPDIFLGKDFLKNYKLPFDNNSFDSTVSFQVLEHHIDPKMMIAEMARVTKPGGYILLTAPFLGGLHEEPHDYQRLTKYGIKVLLENNKYKKVFKEQGSLFSTISLLFNEYLTSYMFHRNLKRYLCITIYPIFLLFSYLSFILDKFIKSNKIFLTILY